MLEQFYDGGTSRADVQIHLPLGRYVPEFRDAPPVVAATPEAAPPNVSSTRPGTLLPRFWMSALLGLSFTLIGVLLAVGIVRWTTPEPVTPAAPLVPQIPAVGVVDFDNLTGQPVLDDDIALFAQKLTDLLGRFDDLQVGTSGAQLGGTVQQADGRFVIRATLRPGDGGGTAWSTTINTPPGIGDTAALEAGAEALAGQLGNATGPLHAPGRAWLALQTGKTPAATRYVCDLMFMSWRERRDLPDAERGSGCLSELLAQNPDDALALASVAGLGAWRSQFMATSKSDLAMEMAEVTTAASRAVILAPASSYAHEQQGLVLARQGSIDAAIGAVARARELNPANIDARMVHGALLWLSGSMDEGAAIAESGLAAIPSPPPWYYLTRALDALQEERFFDAIDAAQALAVGDSEIGAAIALAAAPRAGRGDLVDRFRPIVMSNPHFQASGIIPRLSILTWGNPILAKVREGMLLAGIPANALDRPFNADGSPVLDAAP